MPSGDDIKAGRGTSASNPTVILASKDDDGNDGFILPSAVVEAGPTDSDGDVPNAPFAGVMGRGSHGFHGDPSTDFLPMPGAIGYGGKPSSRQGGAGVTGVGGSDNYDFAAPATTRDPGPGVFGVGGFTDTPPVPRFGAGVVGISGARVHDSDMPDPPPATQTVNTGVFGSSTVGVGVVGTGGVGGVTGVGGPTGVTGSGTSVGVRGVSGAPGATPNNSAAGVLGNGRAAPGVIGISRGDRGGVFTSAAGGTPVAQLRLIPHTPASLPGSPLPKTGLPGDLFVRQIVQRQGPSNRAELWFCIAGDGKTTATWGRVQYDDVQVV